MSRSRALSIVPLSLALILLALSFTACGGGDEADAPPHEEPALDVRSGHVCTDEYEQALSYTSDYGRFGTSVLGLWDGTPFIVDIDAALPNADELMYDIEREAELVRLVLGYDLFVPGDVLYLNRNTHDELAFSGPEATHLLPLNGHIEIRCCVHGGGPPGTTGLAYPWFRQTLLIEDSFFYARGALIHELYHLFGFVHPDEQPGVEMSSQLFWGSTGPVAGRRTYSVEADWARLACIYDSIAPQVQSA